MMNKKFKKLKVLAYHKIENAEKFEKQIEFLKEKYHILNMIEFENYSPHQTFIKNPILITFDDGDISLYINAFPVLKKHNLHAIIFVITNLIGTKKPFWWDEIKYYLGQEEGEKKVWEVKNWENKDRENFIEGLRNTSEKILLEKDQLSISQLKEMQESGISIANHSHTHPIFDKCTEQELIMECESSNNILKEFGFNNNVFAYPNGNFSDLSEKILKNFNINFVFLFNHKINFGEINPMRISRLIVNDCTPIWKYKFILSGNHSKILPLVKSLFRIIKK